MTRDKRVGYITF